MKKNPKHEVNPQNSPAAWMVEYEIALQREDWERAARAKRELARFGIRVTRRRKRVRDE